MNEKQFLEALARYAPEVRQAFIDAIQDVTDNVVLAQVVEALERGDENAAWRALGYNPSVFNRFTASLTVAFEQGAMIVLSTLPKFVTDATGIKTRTRINMRDRSAEEWLRNESSTLITQIETDMRENVRIAVQNGLAEGRNPRNTALDIVGRINHNTGHREGGIIGLGQREARWAESARARLLTLDEAYLSMALRDKRFDATVRTAIETGKPLPVATVDRLVDRYRDNALRARGENIGRTETLAALNRSEFEANRQAIEQAQLPSAAVRKVWDSAGDRKVRPSHRALEGQSRAMDEAFLSPLTGARMMHPGDTSLGAGGDDVVQCRCRVKYQLDFAYGVE